MKKTWQSPQLIILTRSKPEEAVLNGCKTMVYESGSPIVTQFQCDLVNGCDDCSGIVDS